MDKISTSWSRLILGLSLVSLVLALFSPGQASALTIANPDAISIKDIRVFQNLWTDGDQLFLMEYNVSYSSVPNVSAGYAFLATLSYEPTSFLIQYRSVVYYNHSVISLYFPNTSALTWNSSDYEFTVQGSSTYFSGLVEGVNLSTSSNVTWVPGNMTTSKALLKTYCLDLASRMSLDPEWLQDDLLSTNRLTYSDTGEIVFLNCIPDLTYVCPSLFASAMYPYDFQNRSYNPLFQTNLLNQTPSRLKIAMDDLGTWIGVPGIFVGGIGLALIFFMLAGRIFIATGSPAAGIVFGIPVIILGNLLGMIPLTVTLALGLVVIVLAGIVFVLGRMP